MLDLALVWFKRDLRLQDHEPLCSAEKHAAFACLYIYEDILLSSPEYDPSHHGFINECLNELQEGLRQRGSELYILRGEATAVLNRLHREFPFKALYSHQETGNDRTYQRDRAVGDWCRAQGVVWHESKAFGIVRRLGDRDGWARRWSKEMRQALSDPPERFLRARKDLGLGAAIQPPQELGLSGDTKLKRQRGGEKRAHEILDSFLHQRGQDYRQGMSSPVRAFDSCSRLSPYLSFGCISLRQVHQLTAQRQQQLKALEVRPKG